MQFLLRSDALASALHKAEVSPIALVKVSIAAIFPYMQLQANCICIALLTLHMPEPYLSAGIAGMPMNVPFDGEQRRHSLRYSLPGRRYRYSTQEAFKKCFNVD